MAETKGGAATGLRGRLTAKGIASLGRGRHHDRGGAGLLLVVDEGGARRWVQRIMVHGKRREIGLGGWPLVSLASARDAALDNKRAALAGRDPIADKAAARDAAKAAAASARAQAVTFEKAARATHAEVAATFKSEKSRAAFLSRLEAWAFPALGSKSVADVTPADVRAVVLACRAKAPAVAAKLVVGLSAVFRHAVAEGLRADNPATAEALALPRAEKQRAHRKALPYADVPSAIDAVRASGAFASTKLAFEWLALTACRSGEARGARWDEIDREAAVWRIPKARMKSARDHVVPLPPRCLEILDAAEALRDASGLLFPSPRGKELSDMTLSKLLKELGFDADIHGLRTSFRTWAQERTSFPREVAELALAHRIGDATEAAYARSDMLAKRRRLMDAWADFLAAQRGKVVRLAR